MGKIYIRDFKRTRNTKIEDIIEIMTHKGSGLSKATYTIGPTGKEYSQCPANKNRSVNDILDVVKTYFPNATDRSIIRKLVTYMYNYNKMLWDKFGITDYDMINYRRRQELKISKPMLFLNCPDVKKLVVYHSAGIRVDYKHGIFAATTGSEFDFPDELVARNRNKYTLLEVLQLSGYKFSDKSPFPNCPFKTIDATIYYE